VTLKIALDPMLVRSRSIAEVVDAAAEAGFGALEWSAREDFLPVGRRPRASSQRIQELRGLAAAAGVEIVSVGAFYEWCSPEDALRQASVSYLKRAIEIAGELGTARVNTEFRGDPARVDASKSAFRRSLDEVLPTLERNSVRLLVEPHPYDWLESNDRTIDLLTEINHPSLGYIYCAPHTFNMEGITVEQIAYARQRLEYVHVADTQRPERFIVNPPGASVRVHQHLDLGLGEVDWDALFTSLKTAAFDGVVTISVFSSPLDPEESFGRNLRAVTDLAARHGMTVI